MGKQLLVANLQSELLGLAPLVTRQVMLRPKSCTDYHASTAWIHNEDEGTLNNATFYYVTQHIREPPSNFVAFTYPGQLAGWAYGVNVHGVAQSINALFPLDVQAGGVGVQFVARDVLDSTSVDDAIKRATGRGQASGQHFNIASRMEPHRQVSIETSPSRSSVLDPVPAGFAHMNEYIRLNGTVPQGPDESSIHRMARLRSLPVPKSNKDLIEAISDRTDSHFPIYRTPQTAWDDCGTLTTALFDIEHGLISIWDSRPSMSSPAAVLRWDDPGSWKSSLDSQIGPSTSFV